MRKVLLSLACAAVAAVSAQTAKTEMMSKDAATFKGAPELIATSVYEKGSVVYQGPQKAYADGVYFRVPQGSMWAVSPRPGYGYNRPNNFVCPLTDLFYENMSTKKDGQWGIKTASSFIDLTDEVDENGNLCHYYSGGEGAYYAPQYTEGEITYIPAKNGQNLTNYCVSGWTLSNVPNLGVDGAKWYGGGILQPYVNLYGAGSYNDIASQGFVYTLAKPMANLYVEQVSLWANVRDSSEPVVGQGFQVLVFNAEDESATQPVEVLTCTPEQVVNDRDNYYALNFTKKELDEISGEMVDVPFTIDYKAEMYFLGFNQEGCNINVFGFEIPTEFLTGDDDVDNSYVLLGDKSIAYNGNTVAAVCFQAYFNKIDVLVEDTDSKGVTAYVNGMLVSADGQTCKNIHYGANKGAFADVALDWFATDEQGEIIGENYWSDDAAEVEWIQSLNCTDSKETIDLYEIAAVCDALPEGQTKRVALIHLNGNGCTSYGIYVFQGAWEYDEMQKYIEDNPDAINAIAADANKNKVAVKGIFNMAGQRVGENYKGLVVKNGVKMMNK